MMETEWSAIEIWLMDTWLQLSVGNQEPQRAAGTSAHLNKKALFE